MKHLYILGLTFSLSFGAFVFPAYSSTHSHYFISDDEIRVSVTNTSVRIQNAADQTLEIYDITGKKVAIYHIDSTDRVFSLGLPKGYYILKIGNFTRKISIY